MPDGSDYFRGYARDVAVDPEVSGADNVQDALSGIAGSGVTIGGVSDEAEQDTPTALPSDGADHNVTCVTATPPDWMDDAGNITASGLYLISTKILTTAAATTPALYLTVLPPRYAPEYVALDALGSDGAASVQTTTALNASDLPFEVTTVVTVPNDATYTATGTIFVFRLAWSLAIV